MNDKVHKSFIKIFFFAKILLFIHTLYQVSCEGNCTLRPGEMLEFNMMLSCPEGLNNFDFSARCTNNSG